MGMFGILVGGQTHGVGMKRYGGTTTPPVMKSVVDRSLVVLRHRAQVD